MSKLILYPVYLPTRKQVMEDVFEAFSATASIKPVNIMDLFYINWHGPTGIIVIRLYLLEFSEH